MGLFPFLVHLVNTPPPVLQWFEKGRGRMEATPWLSFFYFGEDVRMGETIRGGLMGEIKQREVFWV